MLNFKKISLQDKDVLKKLLGNNADRICENTPGLILTWDVEDGRYMAVENDTLYIATLSENKADFNFPVGADSDALDKIAEYCKANDLALSFSYLSENQKNLLERKFACNVKYDRDWSDYIYLADDLKTLSGKKYHGQKNHVNRFIKDYSDHVFLPFEAGLVPEILRFSEKFYEEKQSDNKLFLEDKKLFFRMLDEAEKIGQLGGVLKSDDEVVAVSFGEIVGDTLYVHYEKALRSCPGSYAMINYLFANRYAKNATYINREEDCGDEGLREAKLALHPVLLADKYFAEVIF
ncbi:MAG: phosphatidylglycerol lysyltransferase domain-containing protein [Clostridiales bacterium]|nr:phosphatidylglycerol lysyltransferase domain-containing protein [Clostridiales bacterium]